MTQRLAEAVLAGCLPITPAAIAGADTFTPPVLHAADGQQVIDRIEHLQAIAATAAHTSLIARCLEHLSPVPAVTPDGHPRPRPLKLTDVSAAFLRHPGSISR
jgi:hypothetical protein